jgi:hypothetical protein
MTPAPVTCSLNDWLEECELRVRDLQVRRLLVADKQGGCVGMLGQADIVLHETSEKVRHLIAGTSGWRGGSSISAKQTLNVRGV